MARFLAKRALGRFMAMSLMVSGALLHGGPSNDAIVNRLSALERVRLGQLQAFEPQTLAAMAARIEPSRLEARAQELASLGSPAIGSRPLDETGRAPIHTYLLREYESLAPEGLEWIGSFRAEVAAPVSLDRLRDVQSREGPARIEVDGEILEVHPLWPNGPMPSLAPSGGLSGKLVHCAGGDWDDLRGLDLNGAIALLEFRGAINLERLFSLGVAAVIVLEDNFVHYQNSTFLYSQTPTPFPRFYAEAAVRDRLLRLCGPDRTGPQVVLHGGQIYENRPIESFFFRLPAPDYVRYTVPQDLLLDWIAAENGITGAELADFNELGSRIPQPGDTLRLPGGRGEVLVPSDGMWSIVARIHDLDTEALKAANPDKAGVPLTAGMSVAIPTETTPLAILVPIDAASVVPDLEHGGRMQANVAVAIELMHHLACDERLRIRRDVIFGFIDGDTLGGQGSRLVAEYLYDLETPFRSSGARGDTSEVSLERYRAGAQWFASGVAPQSAQVRTWLADEWLRPRFEERRITIAEQRIARIVGERGSEKLPPLEELEARLLRIAALRDTTIGAGGSSEQRLANLQAAWAGPQASELEGFGLGLNELRARFMRELKEEEQSAANADNNRKAARALRAAVQGERGALAPYALAWWLDLGDSAPHLGIIHSPTYLRQPSGDVSLVNSLGSRMRTLAAFAATRAGWTESATFVAGEDRALLPMIQPRQPVTYDDMWLNADLRVLALGSASDRLERIDTPRDTVAAIDWKLFSVQARTAFALIGAGLESVLDTRVQENKRRVELARVSGKTVQFNIRSGIDARDPVPGTAVFLPLTRSHSGFAERNADAFYGYRRGIVMLSRLNGSFAMPPERVSMNLKPRINAYYLDRQSAVFSKVATEGQVGTKPQKSEFSYRAGEVTEKNLVMIDVYPRVVFVGVNPSDLKPVLGTAYDQRRIDLIDAVIEGAPRDFAVDNPMLDFRERERDAVVIYVPEGDRVRVSVRLGLEYSFMLTGRVDATGGAKAKGDGILIGPDPETGARNVTLPLTPLHVARGMTDIAVNRLSLYREYGIFARDLQSAAERGQELLGEAEAAVAERDWQKAVGAAREAWGIQVKNFPRVLQLGREAVFSVILLMALAVPGAWFLERLVIGSKGIVARLTGVAALFILVTLFLNQFHPAFKVALSPFIIVIAFTMILMSVIVLALSYGRFEVVLRRYRSAGGEVQGEEISLMSSLATAFALGVSNLKKRMFRTVLTAFTVTVLTFSIVGFVAVKGSDALTRNAVQLDATVEGRPIDPLPPTYDGILIRSHNWRAVEESMIAALEAEFGARYPVTVRAHYMQVEGGNSANREGVNQIPVHFNGRSHVLHAVSALQPNEREFTGLHRAVSGEVWFRGSATPGADNPTALTGDRFCVILPDEAAATLGITADMLLDDNGNLRPTHELPVVTMLNLQWHVIGILDTDHANRIRDVNGKSLAVVDYLRSGMSTETSVGEIVSEGTSYHMDWKRLAIIPYAARYDVDAKPRSVAVRIPEGEDPAQLFDDMALRLKTEFFAAVDGEIAMIVPRKKVDFAGLAKIFLPVLLCVLIVMNTMLGTVEERRGEVGMLGAIGLSPRQIAFFMFAESTVFSVLGILFGAFGGLLFANIVNAINAGGGSFLTSLSFNFTSLTSMVLATCTGLVVLLATLMPARKAAALAAPSGMTEWVLPDDMPGGEIHFRLPFTLTRGNAVGMAAFFHQFLVNHSDSTSDDFNCRNVIVSCDASAERPYIELSTDMWLAPYDLDVAQHFFLRMQARERESVFEVDLRMLRFSGSEENGRRTAYNLLNLVRKQFLLWRNLDPQHRTELIEKGARMLADHTVQSPES